MFRGQAATCRRDRSNLTEADEHHVVAFFARLVADTCAALDGDLLPRWAAMDVGVASGATRDLLPGRELPARVAVAWEAWPAIWADLMARNPRLALAGAIADIGARADGQSPLPWRATVGGEVHGYEFDRLRRLRLETAGSAWFDRHARRRVFRSDRPVVWFEDDEA